MDPHKVNLGVTVFMAIKTNRHNQAWFETLRNCVRDIPEVVEFYRMSGEMDYLLRVVLPDIAAFDGVYRRLTRSVERDDVSSSFAMEEIKFTTALHKVAQPLWHRQYPLAHRQAGENMIRQVCRSLYHAPGVA